MVVPKRLFPVVASLLVAVLSFNIPTPSLFHSSHQPFSRPVEPSQTPNTSPSSTSRFRQSKRSQTIANYRSNHSGSSVHFALCVRDRTHKMGRSTKQMHKLRCERCILMHRPCDATIPSCKNCSNHRNGPLDCVYPEGSPSRSELKRRKMEEAAAQQAKLDEQAANRKAAGITYGFGTGKYGTVPDSWPERYGGKGGYQNVPEASDLKGGGTENVEDQSKENKRKRRRVKKKTLPTADANRGEAIEEEIDITQNFPSLSGGAPSAGPMENNAPTAPSLGTPFDPHINPDWFNRTRKSPEQIRESLYRLMALRLPETSPNPETNEANLRAETPLTLEEIGRNLATSIENSLPKHSGGVLNGFSDWSQVDVAAPTTKEEQEEELRMVEALVHRLYPVIFNKDAKKKDK